MPKVKVWNDNTIEHVEKFKDEEVRIPAGGFVEMEWEEAIEFKGQFKPMIIRADGTHDPKGFKKIRVDRPSEPVFKDDPNVLHATGQKVASQAELKALMAVYAAQNPDLAVRDEQESSKIASLEAQIAELKALITGQGEKKGPGRPKKEANA